MQNFLGRLHYRAIFVAKALAKDGLLGKRRAGSVCSLGVWTHWWRWARTKSGKNKSKSECAVAQIYQESRSNVPWDYPNVFNLNYIYIYSFNTSNKFMMPRKSRMEFAKVSWKLCVYGEDGCLRENECHQSSCIESTPQPGTVTTRIRGLQIFICHCYLVGECGG